MLVRDRTNAGGFLMTEQEKKQKKNDRIKQKIRERYRGVSEDMLDVIPAMPQEDFYKSEVHKRVAVYARVSTDDPNQTSSYELQKNHYEDMVNRRPNWDLVDIYADEGISGTSLQHRDSFLRMIEDCKTGKIDLIVTKSVSRFARNIIDCIGYVRQLKSYEPPIGVFFETENIYTLNENSEMSLSFIATLAQEESHTKSEIMNSSIEMRFKMGIFLTPVLLGYDHDEEGNLIVNKDEALTVKYIYYSYIYGKSTQEIADELTEMGRLTKKGNATWSVGSVLETLSNERYCGDVLARKTFTPNYLNHKAKVNRHDRNQYRQKDHHEAIIPREDFFAVQKIIRNARYGNKGYFPEIHAVMAGYLKGFVTIHPKWAGFSKEDYLAASTSAVKGTVEIIPSRQIILQPGDFDFRGYELVRSQLVSSFGQMSVTVSDSRIQFNKICVGRLWNVQKIELLVSPEKRMLAVRKAPLDSKYGIEWIQKHSGGTTPKNIGGKAFLPVMYSIFGWKKGYDYKMTGTIHGSGDNSIIVFDTHDAIMLLPTVNNTATINTDPVTVTPPKRKKRKRGEAFPTTWASSFGDSYYKHKACIEAELSAGSRIFDATDTSPFRLDNSDVTTPEKAFKYLKEIVKHMRRCHE